MSSIVNLKSSPLGDSCTGSVVDARTFRSGCCGRSSRRSGRRIARARRCSVSDAVTADAVLVPSRDEDQTRSSDAAAEFVRRIGSSLPESSLADVAERFCRRQAALCSPPLAAWLYADGLAERRCAAASTFDLEDNVAQSSELSPRAEPRRVTFNLGCSEVYDVTPYSEIYGLHPREFVFGRDLSVVPSGDAYGFIDFLAASQRQQAFVGGEVDQLANGDDDRNCDSDSDAEEIEWW